MFMGTVFFPILNQTEFHLAQNRKENCLYDHIPFNVKGIGRIVFSVYNDQAYSCPKDCRLSASWGSITRHFLRIDEHHGNIVRKGV